MDPAAGVTHRFEEVVEDRRGRVGTFIAMANPAALAPATVVLRLPLLAVVGRIAEADKDAHVLLDFLRAFALLGQPLLQDAGRELRQPVGGLQRIGEINPRRSVGHSCIA